MLKPLEECQTLVMKLPYPYTPKGTALLQALTAFGIPEKECTTKAWTGIKKVLASKYNERAYIATKKIGISLDQIRMAVLIQKVPPHSSSCRSSPPSTPSSSTPKTLSPASPMNSTPRWSEDWARRWWEGMPDRPSASWRQRATSACLTQIADGKCKVLSICNKSVGMKTAGGYMFRSDSNAEDLPGFAGAGLFDSFPSEPAELFPVRYGTVSEIGQL